MRVDDIQNNPESLKGARRIKPIPSALSDEAKAKLAEIDRAAKEAAASSHKIILD